MKRLARIIAVIGGIVAVIWAMRDRLVSVAISREPEPPAFRAQKPPPTLEHTPPAPSRKVPPSSATAAASPPTSGAAAVGDVKTVKGIGPVFAGRLAEAGITDVAQLAATRPEKVAAAAQVALSRAAGWVEAARQLG